MALYARRYLYSRGYTFRSVVSQSAVSTMIADGEKYAKSNKKKPEIYRKVGARKRLTERVDKNKPSAAAVERDDDDDTRAAVRYTTVATMRLRCAARQSPSPPSRRWPAKEGQTRRRPMVDLTTPLPIPLSTLQPTTARRPITPRTRSSQIRGARIFEFFFSVIENFLFRFCVSCH